MWSATPLFANNTIYIGKPFYRIFALNPGTGKVKWTFSPKTLLKALTQPALKTRGVAYWQAAHLVASKPCQKRVYIGTMDAKLYAVDADTGKLCTDFANHGMLNINQWNNHKEDWPLSILQPATVYKNLLLVGWAGKDWALAKAPAGTVFEIDARTGKLVWTFHAIPPAIAAKSGTANVWASMSIDSKKGILYLPVSSPSPNYWGGNRLQKIPYATSLTALDINTGRVIWSRQLVHHDIWDYDTNSAPTLININKDGKVIPALVQTTKQGYLYILNRYTGKPIYPIFERPVPSSTAQGEIFAKLKYEGKYTPPSTQGSLAYPGPIGGVEWEGGAFDPKNHIFIVNASSAAYIYKLIPKEKQQTLTKSQRSTEDSNSYYPMKGAPYGIQLTPFLNPYGMP